MQERGLRERIVNGLNKWEGASRNVREMHDQWLEQTENSFANIPMNPALRQVLKAHRAVISSFTIEPFFDALSTSEHVATKVRQALSPKK